MLQDKIHQLLGLQAGFRNGLRRLGIHLEKPLKIAFRQIAEINKILANATTKLSLPVTGLFKLFMADQAILDEPVSQLFHGDPPQSNFTKFLMLQSKIVFNKYKIGEASLTIMNLQCKK